MSLREKQKAIRAREIMNAAAFLFEKQGYTNTKIEDIAEQAFVAPGTVYNYFGSKDGLMQQIVRTHISERHAERKRFLDKPPLGLNEAIEAYTDLLLDRAFVLIGREIWRQVLASGISAGRDRSDYLGEVTGALVEQFEQLLSTFKDRGIFAPDAPIHDLAEAAMGIADFHFYRFVCHDDGSLDETKNKIRKQLQLLLSGSLAQSDD